ncbi:YgjV family protein [Candidatus Woesebacteria bacterium]|nr:YgjV family protein [Candidatus Woesebacteria bacterium]
MNNFIIQGFGYLALIFVIISFQKNTRKTILAIMLTGLLLFVGHYILLGAVTGAVMNLIEAGVVFVAYKKETEKWAQHKWWPIFFISAFIFTGLIVGKNIVDSLPIFAQIAGTVAVYQTRPKAIRFIMLIPRPLWFFYNFSVGSYAGMVAEIFIGASVLLGIIRFDILGHKEK